MAATDTYLAGCTDKGFASSKCTRKGAFDGQQWVGLQLCDGDYKENDNPWAGCQKRTPAETQIVKEPQCSCDPDKALVRAGRTLAAVVSLPTSALGTLTFQSGFSPSGGTPAPGGSRDDSPNPGSDASASRDPEGLSSGAIAGIAVGSVLGAVIVGLLVLLVLMRQRKKKRQQQQQQTAAAVPAQNTPPAFPSPQYPQTQEYMQPQYSPFAQYPPQYPNYQSYSPVLGAQSYSPGPRGAPEGHGPGLHGFKSELAADDPSQPAQRTPSPQSPEFSQLSPKDSNANNYQSDRLSTISGLSGGNARSSSAGFVTPQTTGSTDYNPNGGGGGGGGATGRNGPATMAPINELQG